MTDEESLVKVHIDLTGHPETGGEAMWAAALGNDLYELRNTPFYAFSLNFLDVVRAISAGPELKPSVLSVERRSGHRTIWLTFADRVPAEERIRLATSLNEWHAYFEHAKGPYFAIDVEPRGDYGAALRAIEGWRVAGIVRRYRTGPSDSDVQEA
jgi:hypothetical protein